MTRTVRNFLSVLALTFVLGAGLAVAQENSSAQAPAATAAQPAGNVVAAPAPEAPAAAAQPEGKKTEEGEEHADLKYNKVVMWLAHSTGMSREAAYWTFVVLNFLILAGAMWFTLRSAVPAALKARSAAIREDLEKARKASADAAARLTEIEARLGRLDTEVAAIRAAAETDFSGEEKRIQQAAEEDAKRVVEGAQQEIATATRTAQRELKAYAADLAVGLAEKKIKVDAATDDALVRGFVGQLGKDGE